MGRHPCTSRLTVEECRYLDATTMHQNGVFRSLPGSMWKAVWKDSNRQIEAELNYILKAPGCVQIRSFDDQRENGRPFQRYSAVYHIEIIFRNGRYCFCCPLARNGRSCGRRVRLLYLPPGQRVFGCRLCHNLTYKSAQQHDKRKTALIRDPIALVTALRSGERRRQLLGIGAYAEAVARLGRR